MTPRPSIFWRCAVALAAAGSTLAGCAESPPARSAVSPSAAADPAPRQAPSAAASPVPPADAGPEPAAVDPTMAAAFAELLDELAVERAPGASPASEPWVFQFREAEGVERAVTVDASRCYTVVARGLAPVERIDLVARGFGADPGDRDPAPLVDIVGGDGACLRPAPGVSTARVLLRVPVGAGVAGARVYGR